MEDRVDDSWLNAEALIRENEWNLAACKAYGCAYILIDEEYNVDL